MHDPYTVDVDQELLIGITCLVGGQCVTDQPVLPRPYWGSPIGDVMKRGGGWLTPELGVRLGGTEGANGLFPMGVKEGV